jgi:hypothetical protein
MVVRSRPVESVVAVVAVAVGEPLVEMLFPGVFGYCYMEWLYDTLKARLSMPLGPMRMIEASP